MTVTLIPTLIDLAAPEIANVQRGAFEQYGVKPPPAGWPYRDVYVRWTWRDFEPDENDYQWSLIDTELARAKALGGRFGMRIMPANSLSGGSGVPQYLMDRMPLGFWFTYPGGTSVYAPDWNDPDYMARAKALIQAIAAHCASNDAFGWIEIGPYGDWGEWHVWQWPYPSPDGAEEMSLANRQQLIDAHVQAFPDEKLVQMVDSVSGSTPTMAYALAKSPRIGVRGDCFGDPLFDTRMNELAAVAPDRWKTAPILVEFCGGGTGQYTMGLTQVQAHHVAMIGGNFGDYTAHSTQEQQDFDTLRKLAGYRFALSSLELPQPIVRGAAATVTATWNNLGVAPAHHPWQVVYQLVTGAGTAAWEGISAGDVRSLLPGPATVTDQFTFPSTVADGPYTLRVVVRDTGGYAAPMALSIEGRLADGSYSLGTVEVQ